MKVLVYMVLVSVFCLSFSGVQDPTKNPPVFSNILTPDGDGKDDVFSIGYLEEYPENELMILNRWGNEVHKASPYKGDWNGNCSSCKKGQEKLPDGEYYYLFTDKQTGIKYKGHFTLIQGL